MEKGDRDGARIYAEGAIREKNQALNYLRLSARIDGVAQRVQTAVSMNMLTKSMGGVVKSMDAAMQSMDAEAISGVMDKFEKQFEDLDISTQFMENSMQSSTVQTMPVSQVDELMMKVADEHGLEFDAAMRDPSLKSTVNRSEEAKV
jgi:charged multivesicular body protein 1